MSGLFQGRGGYNNGVFGRKRGYNNGKGVLDCLAVGIICQICLSQNILLLNGETDITESSLLLIYHQTTILLTSSEGAMADQGWYLDSGATHHLTNNLQNLNLGVEYSSNQLLHVGNGQGLHISYIGYTCFHTYDILYVPAITKNLISISKLLEDNNITIEFVANLCFIKDMKKAVHLGQWIATDGFYQLLSKADFLFNSKCLAYVPSSMLSFLNNSTCISSTSTENKTCIQSVKAQCHVNSTQSTISGNLLHQRFGHPCKHTMKCILPHVF